MRTFKSPCARVEIDTVAEVLFLCHSRETCPHENGERESIVFP